MERKIAILVAVTASLLCAPVSAASSCPRDHICASDPEGVAQAIRDLGFRAELTVHQGTGDPMIKSAAAGHNFTIHFNECTKSADCKSLGFLTVFEDDGTNTARLANAWNKSKRFSQMSANDNGTMSFSYDVTTVGGLNKANFADVVDWWQSMLGQVTAFFRAQATAK